MPTPGGRGTDKPWRSQGATLSVLPLPPPIKLAIGRLSSGSITRAAATATGGGGAGAAEPLPPSPPLRLAPG